MLRYGHTDAHTHTHTQLYNRFTFLLLFKMNINKPKNITSEYFLHSHLTFFDFHKKKFQIGEKWFKNTIFGTEYPWNIVKLLAKSKLILAKSKLKSLPYNHTAHPATQPPTTLNQVYTSLYKSYINIWGIIRIVHSRAIYLSIVTHPNQTKSTFDWQFSDLNYIKIKLNLTAE